MVVLFSDNVKINPCSLKTEEKETSLSDVKAEVPIMSTACQRLQDSNDRLYPSDRNQQPYDLEENWKFEHNTRKVVDSMKVFFYRRVLTLLLMN